jgi:hypothetical protein
MVLTLSQLLSALYRALEIQFACRVDEVMESRTVGCLAARAVSEDFRSRLDRHAYVNFLRSAPGSKA